MSLVNHVMNASNKKEVHQLLSGVDLGLRYRVLTEAIERLNAFVDKNIQLLSDEITLDFLRHVVVLEDELHVVERYLLKRAVSIYDV